MDESFWEQIERARRMTGDQRFREGLELFDRAIQLMSDGIRHEYPNADSDEVRRIRRERLARIRAAEARR